MNAHLSIAEDASETYPEPHVERDPRLGLLIVVGGTVVFWAAVAWLLA